jgi:hypothetical protein
MFSKLRLFLLALASLCILVTASPLIAANFDMVVSAGAQGCLPTAKGTVKISRVGAIDFMVVSVDGLPPNTGFDFFVLQVPKAPFGVAWYQGDIETDDQGHGQQHFAGVFSIETFAVAVGSAPAPVVFTGPFPDASLNPPFNPIQMYHLGLWFNSPMDAQAAGCPATVTAFNGEHNAGIQVLNTSNYPDNHGPLLDVNP